MGGELDMYRGFAEKAEVLLGKDGTQKAMLESMRSRAEWYDTLDYHACEAKLDRLFAPKENPP